MTALAPLGPKLGKLIRMLASPRDGEVVAAARAIMRTLQGASLDIHALAQSVETGAPAAAPGPRPPDAKELRQAWEHGYSRGDAKGYERGYNDGYKDGQQEAQDANNETEFCLSFMANECWEKRLYLHGREIRFIRDMVDRTARGDHLTSPQEQWLRAIFGRLKGL